MSISPINNQDDKEKNQNLGEDICEKKLSNNFAVKLEYEKNEIEKKKEEDESAMLIDKSSIK